MNVSLSSFYFFFHLVGSSVAFPFNIAGAEKSIQSSGISASRNMSNLVAKKCVMKLEAKRKIEEKKYYECGMSYLVAGKKWQHIDKVEVKLAKGGPFKWVNKLFNLWRPNDGDALTSPPSTSSRTYHILWVGNGFNPFADFTMRINANAINLWFFLSQCYCQRIS